MTKPLIFVHHTLTCAPRTFAEVAANARRLFAESDTATLYGAWRAQIGRPRDELNVITVSHDEDHVETAALLLHTPEVREVISQPMCPTLRPLNADPPTRQGNYAFRWFELPEAHWDEFLSLCEGAWPGFESAYDSQVIGLWRILNKNMDDNGQVAKSKVGTASNPQSARALLLTRRPDLAMWERSKIPANADEREVRRKLSRRYDLCEATWVYTTTLLDAADKTDNVRWA